MIHTGRTDRTGRTGRGTRHVQGPQELSNSRRFPQVPAGTRSSTPTYALWQREIPVPALDKRNGLDHQTRPLGGIGNQRKKRWWWDYQHHKRIEPMEMPYIRGWGGGGSFIVSYPRHGKKDNKHVERS